MSAAKGFGLLLVPTESLVIEGKAADTVEVQLVLKNSNDNIRLAYKVKPASPSLIRTQPVIGILEPQQSAVVTVRRMPYDPEQYSGNVTKLLVMSLPISGKVNEPKVFWATTEKEPVKNRISIKIVQT
ncbi:MSP domain protein [Trichuris suis]|nr:MSP domain protein [Trichuris suis]